MPWKYSIRFVSAEMDENPDHIRLCFSLVMVSNSVISGIMNSNRMFFTEISLSLPVNRRTKIRYNTGVAIPPTYSSFDQRTLSVGVSAAVSKIIQNDPIPAAIISQANSRAPFTVRRRQARRATKNETNAVTRKKKEYIVNTRFI
jgi:hypothetical protein